MARVFDSSYLTNKPHFPMINKKIKVKDKNKPSETKTKPVGEQKKPPQKQHINQPLNSTVSNKYVNGNKYLK